ncbi:unnamed protein product [Angiostrongylus costaricensis]|uniref:Tick transposon n=1 Tax=Angiostrongylus costaricensis TaxID=334426 RepID=A0A158PEE4_ANGCS|nr:unnamed protein product [Angiostrongylus costaricensis]
MASLFLLCDLAHAFYIHAGVFMHAPADVVSFMRIAFYESIPPKACYQPKELPIDRPLHAYANDPPITNTGDLLARIIAKGIYSTSYVPDLIYSSPALRCLQTAKAVRSICDCQAHIRCSSLMLSVPGAVRFFTDELACRISEGRTGGATYPFSFISYNRRVEPGLFENLSMYPNGLPQFATPEQRAQFNVDERYRPHMSISDLRRNLHETAADYNSRLRNTLLRIAKMHEVVGHASTVDLAAGHLAKSSRKSTEHDLTWSYRKIPVGSTLVLERVQGRRGWTPNLYAIPPVTYTGLSNQFSAPFVLRDAPVVKE